MKVIGVKVQEYHFIATNVEMMRQFFAFHSQRKRTEKMKEKEFDFKKQPKNKKEEIEWLRNAIWQMHLVMNKRKDYRELRLKNEYKWLLLFTGMLNDFEKEMGVVITSGWYHNMREYHYLPEAWNSLPFKLKINREWGTKIYQEEAKSRCENPDHKGDREKGFGKGMWWMRSDGSLWCPNCVSRDFTEGIEREMKKYKEAKK